MVGIEQRQRGQRFTRQHRRRETSTRTFAQFVRRFFRSDLFHERGVDVWALQKWGIRHAWNN